MYSALYRVYNTLGWKGVYVVVFRPVLVILILILLAVSL